MAIHKTVFCSTRTNPYFKHEMQALNELGWEVEINLRQKCIRLVYNHTWLITMSPIHLCYKIQREIIEAMAGRVYIARCQSTFSGLARKEYFILHSLMQRINALIDEAKAEVE